MQWGFWLAGLAFLPRRRGMRRRLRQGVWDSKGFRASASRSRLPPRGNHLDPAALAQRIADTINEQSSRLNMKVKAHASDNAGDGDAVLEITILSETVEAVTPARIRILIKDSATLMRLDGTPVWREMEAESSIARNVAQGDPADVWEDPHLADGVEKALSNRLVFRMLYYR